MKTNDNLTGRWELTEIHYQREKEWKLWKEFAPGDFTWKFEESSIPNRGLCTQQFKDFQKVIALYAYFHAEGIMFLNYADTPHLDDFYRVVHTDDDNILLYCLRYNEEEYDDCMFRITARKAVIRVC